MIGFSRRQFLAAAAQPLWGADPNRPPFRLVDITKQSGINFKHNNGGFGKKYLPETLGSGCAVLDFDNDGWQDILLVNGSDWPGHVRGPSALSLLKNNRDGTFRDVTRQAGLAIPMYGMGVAVGDYNNDGLADIFVSCVGQSRLFQNTGKGTFIDVTRQSGLGKRDAFSSSALWFDYDRDGLLDLLQHRREAKSILHSGGVPRQHVLAIPESGQWKIRGCYRSLRAFR